MLAGIIRKVVPIKARQLVGFQLLNQASKTLSTLRLYLKILHGKCPDELGLRGNWCTFTYEGIEIKAPRNSAEIFLEMFQDKVYEEVWKPQEGDTVIDLGAYVGMFTVKASKLVGASGRVIAIEPEPEAFSLLKENTKTLNNVTLVKKAIWDKEGTFKLYYSKVPGWCTLTKSWEGYTEVETTTLNKLLEELGLSWVDFLKLDAEGAEFEILEKAPDALRKIGRISIATYHKLLGGEDIMCKVRDFLQSNGFSIIQKRGLRGYTYATKT